MGQKIVRRKWTGGEVRSACDKLVEIVADFGSDASVLKMCKRWMISGVRVIPAWLTVCLIVACIHLSFVTSSAFMLRLVGWTFASLLVFVVFAAALGSRKRRRAAAAKSREEHSTQELAQEVNLTPENQLAPEKVSRCRRARSARTLPCRRTASSSQSSRFNLPRFS
jgi:hypothetical protein